MMDHVTDLGPAPTLGLGRVSHLHMTAGCWNAIFPGVRLTQCGLPTHSPPLLLRFSLTQSEPCLSSESVLKGFLFSPLKSLFGSG